MPIEPTHLTYLLAILAIWAIYFGIRLRTNSRSLAILTEATEAGLLEPASLHPVIDQSLCIGCGACVSACPEGQVLGLVYGKVALVDPAECIGHGACRTACPNDAIELVFGTESRGVEIPHVGADFQTNVSGIFIAGELGGMGLIRNAIEQGRQAMASIGTLIDEASPAPDARTALDVVIVGGGPAGISASLAAIERKLRFVTLEQDTFGGTVAHFPRGKLVMTQPATLPIVGKVSFREVSKEKLLAYWQKVARQTGLKIRYGERVEQIAMVQGGFEVRTSKAVYRTRSALLAIGRRGTPRRLGVPGEEHSKVVYRLVDPEQYRNRHVLVVGGGDSALEAAGSIAEQPGTVVTLSYRGPAFARAKTKNRERLVRLEAAGRLHVLLESQVKKIDRDTVDILSRGKAITVTNQDVIVCAGGILPTTFLKETGISVEMKYGTA